MGLVGQLMVGEVLVILSSLVLMVMGADSCVKDPTPMNCTHYKLPSSIVRKDIDSLCKMMPDMPGCTVDHICSSKEFQSSQYCLPFSILKDICDKDMPKMSDCKNYTSMCAPNSKVVECNTAALPLPTSEQASHLIEDICSEMSMDGCSECKGEGMMLDCDLLTVYSKLCLSMPDMDQCQMWNTMCLQIPDWPLCSNEGPDSKSPPQMRMYFHTGIVDYILFKDWVPRTTGFYVGSWFIIFFAAILAELLKLVRSLLEKRWKYQEALHAHSATDEDFHPLLDKRGGTNSTYVPAHQYIYSQLQAPFHFTIDIPRALLQTLEVGWGFLIMLIAMTFNVGLFLAILAGTFVGTLMVGRFFTYEAKASCH